MPKMEQFRHKLSRLYPESFERVLENMSFEKPTSFRVNTLVSSEEEILSLLRDQGFTVESGPFNNSYYVRGDKGHELSKTELFVSGKIYIQKLESMIPALILDPNEKEKILDLCAAPGSKTTQIAVMTNNNATIKAVEIDSLRCQTLKNIVTTAQTTAVDILCEDGFRLDQRHPEFLDYFDAILVDAPCSNESFINPNDEDIPWWTSKRYKDYSGKQKGLLISAYRMLKPGGRLVYSTCTFDIHENEMVVDWLLKRYPEARVKESILPIENIHRGISVWNSKHLVKDVQNCARIIPNELFNSFFIAKIQKPVNHV